MAAPSFEVELVGLVLVIGEYNCQGGERGWNTSTGGSAAAAAWIFGVEHENGAATSATVAVILAATAATAGVSVARGMTVAVAMVGPGVTIARASVAGAGAGAGASVALGFTVAGGSTTSVGFA